MATIADTVIVTLPNGASVRVAAHMPPERDVSILGDAYVAITPLRDAIAGLSQLVHDAVASASPSKVVVEFSFELSYEAGKLTALLVNGSSKGVLRVALEWNPGSERQTGDSR